MIVDLNNHDLVPFLTTYAPFLWLTFILHYSGTNLACSCCLLHLVSWRLMRPFACIQFLYTPKGVEELGKEERVSYILYCLIKPDSLFQECGKVLDKQWHLVWIKLHFTLLKVLLGCRNCYLFGEFHKNTF